MDVASTQKKLILVIEDDSWTRKAMASIIRHRGWDVAVASTLSRGFDLLEAERPDCLILDLSLPDGSGEAILRRVREARLPIRVVVCTATHEKGRLDGVLKLQPEAVFVKPIEVDEVLAACCAAPESPAGASCAPHSSGV